MRKVKIQLFKAFAVLTATMMFVPFAGCEGGHEHVYGSSWEHDNVSHWHPAICEHASLRGSTSAHDFDENGKCKVCDYEKPDTSPVDTPHEHTFGNSWEYDEAEHWHPATCEHTSLKDSTAAHEFNKDGKCKVCDYKKSGNGDNPDFPDDPKQEEYVLIADHGRTFKNSGWTFVEIYDSEYSMVGYAVSKDTIEISGTVTIPESYNELPVLELYDRCFKECTTLESIEIPESVIQIGYSAFESCTSLNSVKLHEKLTKMGDFVFTGCTALTRIELPDSLTEISNGAFYGCSNLSSVSPMGEAQDGVINLPDNIKRVGESAFMQCPKFRQLVAGESLSSIGRYGFYGLSFTYVTIKNVSNWARINFAVYEENPICIASGNTSLPSSIKIEGIDQIGTYSFVKAKISKVEIGDGVKTIRRDAFYNCKSLSEVILGDSLETIESSDEWGTFSSCTALRTVTGGAALKTIGSNAFNYCTSLVEVSLQSVETIQANAFQDCQALVDVYLGANLKSLSSQAFSGCLKLVSITYGGTKEDWTATIGTFHTSSGGNMKIICTDGELN